MSRQSFFRDMMKRDVKTPSIVMMITVAVATGAAIGTFNYLAVFLGAVSISSIAMLSIDDALMDDMQKFNTDMLHDMSKIVEVASEICDDVKWGH